MARFSKMQVLDAMISTGMVPVYYNKDIETAKQVLKACYEGGVRALNLPTAVTSPMRCLPNW